MQMMLIKDQKKIAWNIITMYELKVKNGTYKADSLLFLLWAIFYHRFHHWKKGEGFTD